MTSKAASLRRIIRSLGLPAKSQAPRQFSTAVHTPLPVRYLHTESFQHGGSRAPPTPLGYDPSQVDHQPILAPLLVDDLLASITEHLQDGHDETIPFAERLKRRQDRTRRLNTPGGLEAFSPRTPKEDSGGAFRVPWIDKEIFSVVPENSRREIDIISATKPLTGPDTSTPSPPGHKTVYEDKPVTQPAEAFSNPSYEHPTSIPRAQADKQTTAEDSDLSQQRRSRTNDAPTASPQADVLAEHQRRLEQKEQPIQWEVSADGRATLKHLSMLKEEESVDRARRRDEHRQARRIFATYVPEEEWSAAYDILQSMTPKERVAHTKQLEIVTLPDGVHLQLLANPGITIAEVMHHTGSFLRLQVQDNLPNSHLYRSLMLHGTKPHNAAAAQYIADRGYFRVLQEGEMNQHITVHEIMDGRSPAPVTTNRDKVQPQARGANHQRIDTTVNQEPGAVVPRGVWTLPPIRVPITPLVEAAMTGIEFAPLALDAAVQQLTLPRPRQQLIEMSRHFEDRQADHILTEALITLLTNRTNLSATTTSTLQSAFTWLAARRQFPALRQILAAHEEFAASASAMTSVSALSTRAFNHVLQGTVAAKDIHAFKYILASMQARNLEADAHTWVQFYYLSHVLFPERVQFLKSAMQASHMLEDSSIRLRLLPFEVGAQLKKEVAAYESDAALPVDFIATFLAKVSQHTTTPNWLTANVASRMVGVLLPLGYWRESFSIYEEMHTHGNSAKLALLHDFLDAANQPGVENASMAIQALQRFSAFFPTTDVRKPAKGTKQGVEVLKTMPISWLRATAETYDKLFMIAVGTRSWNLVRVIWQHACCNGAASLYMRQQVHSSIHLRSKLSASYAEKLKPADFWLRSYGLFAVGVGVKNQRRNPLRVIKSTLFTVQGRAGLKAMRKDLEAYGEVQPVHSLSVDATEAFKLDEQWRAQAKHMPGGALDDTRLQKCEKLRRTIFPFDDVWNAAQEAMLVPVTSCG